MKSKKKTIAIVFHDTIFTSGGTRSLLDLVDKLIEDNQFELLCIFPRHDGTAIDYLKNKNISVITCRYWYCTRPIAATGITRIKLWMKLVLSWINIQILICQELKKYDIDLVYSNTGVIFAGAWISEALKTPHIWHIREFMDTDHGIIPMMGWDRYYAYVSNHCSVAIMISEALKEKHQVGIKNEKIKVIHDDLSPTYLVFPEKTWQERKDNILFAGTVCEGKGQLIAIQALSLLKKRNIEFNLFIAGTVKDRDREYYQLLQNLVREGNLEKQVHFLGQVDNLSEVRKECGIGIVASRTEAFGRVTVEGMLSDLVMVGADAGGTAELINDRRNGFLYPLGDSRKLADILYEISNMNLGKIQKIREMGLTTGKEYISGKCAEKLTGIMNELMD